MWTAHTLEEYRQLETYYEEQAQQYELRAQKEKAELERLKELPFHPRSYATQVESTSNRLDNDWWHAVESSQRATEYRKLVAASPQVQQGSDRQ